MPELPEVESIKRGLERKIIGQKILNIKILNEKIVYSNSNMRITDKNKTNEFINGVLNKIIISIERKAKNIIITFDDSSLVIIHLKMTGQLIYSISDIEIEKKTKIEFKLDHGTMVYNDVRGFGYVLYYTDMRSALTHGHFHNMGIEPFDKRFDTQYLYSKLQDKKYNNKNLKSVLLDQSLVVGIGNIYADEICFASNILPSRICSTLSIQEIDTLYQNIINILEKSISLGGSSVSDYRLSDGHKGTYAKYHKVYRRGGLACYVCETDIDKIVIAGRSTHYCPLCQK